MVRGHKGPLAGGRAGRQIIGPGEPGAARDQLPRQPLRGGGRKTPGGRGIVLGGQMAVRGQQVQKDGVIGGRRLPGLPYQPKGNGLTGPHRLGGSLIPDQLQGIAKGGLRRGQCGAGVGGELG